MNKNKKSRNPVRSKKSNPKAAKVVGKKKRASKAKQVDIAKVRDAVTNIVGAEATKITWAVVGEAKKGQVTPTKYLFEMAGVYPKPPQTEEEEVKKEDQGGDSLVKILMDQLTPPAKPAESEEDEPEESAQAKAPESVGDGAVKAEPVVVGV